jgi:hypothetical protein
MRHTVVACPACLCALLMLLTHTKHTPQPLQQPLPTQQHHTLRPCACVLLPRLCIRGTSLASVPQENSPSKHTGVLWPACPGLPSRPGAAGGTHWLSAAAAAAAVCCCCCGCCLLLLLLALICCCRRCPDTNCEHHNDPTAAAANTTATWLRPSACALLPRLCSPGTSPATAPLES